MIWKAHAGRVFRVQRLWLVLIGVAIGLFFAWCDWPALNGQVDTASSDGHAATLLRNDKLRFYDAVQQQSSLALPTAVQQRRFAAALRTLRAYEEQPDPRLLLQTRGLLRGVKYQLISSTDGYWYVRDGLPARGWGSYVVNRAPRDRLVVEVPRPLDEMRAMEAGAAIFYETGAQALAVAGPANARKPMTDVLTAGETFFQVFHRVYASGPVLAVRGAAITPTTSRGWIPGGVSRLWVDRHLSHVLEVEQVKALVGALVVIWKAPPGANLQRRTTPGGYAELYLNDDDASELVAHLESRAVMATRWSSDGLKERLDDWLLADRKAHPGRDELVASAAQLSFFDREILGPLLRVVETGYRHGKWSSGAQAQLRAIHYAAQGMGYGVARLRHRKAQEEYLVLHATEPLHDRGRYVLRVGGGDDYAVNVLDAGHAPNALEYGLTLFHSLKARALLVAAETQRAGIEPEKSDEGMFVFANRVLKRELGEQAFMIVISRGDARNADTPMPQVQISVALADGTMSRGEATPLAKRLLSTVQRTGFSYRLVDAAVNAAGVRPHIAGSEVATLWLSPQARVVYGATRGTPARAMKGKTSNAVAHSNGSVDHAPIERGDNTRTAFLDLDDTQ